MYYDVGINQKENKPYRYDYTKGDNWKELPYKFYDDVMQYTGLKDKNGMEIYEGDIVKCVDRPYLYICKFGDHETSTDYYNDVAYGWYLEEINTTNQYSPQNIMIDILVGNKYENPELLEGV